MTGVVVPEVAGKRSTTALGKGVVSDALRAQDPAAATAAEQAKDWRAGYVPHFRSLVEAGLPSYDAAVSVAREGLESLHRRMRYLPSDGAELPLREAVRGSSDHSFEAVVVKGEGDRADRELSLPVRGERLRGATLDRQLDRWVGTGTIEPSCAEAVRLVAANPDWLDLSDQQVVLLGAGAEMGPLTSFMRWGGNVVAIDLPRKDLWTRVLDVARKGSGRLTMPVRRDRAGTDLATSAGADLLTELPELTAWLAETDGPLVLGDYVYADGATNLRVAMGVDALTEELLARRSDVALAFLATPTDVFAVPAEAVEHAASGFGQRGALRRMRLPLRAVSGGRLLQRNYPDAVTLDGKPAGINDSLVPQQGPNYALAKRLQRWRAAVARDGGTQVSLNIAPPTRTRSVVKNRALALAYAGARGFGVEVFEPATSNVLMATLLVHDLRNPPAARMHPYEAEWQAAAHGGLWRQPYAPRSVLGLAVLVGLGGARA